VSKKKPETEAKWSERVNRERREEDDRLSHAAGERNKRHAPGEHPSARPGESDQDTWDRITG